MMHPCSPFSLAASRVFAAAFATFALTACQDRPAEQRPTGINSDVPSPSEARRDAGRPTPHAETTHRIVDSDHRHVVRLSVGDRVALPSDPAFDWSIEFENKTAFAAAGSEAGPLASSTYRASAPGLFRSIVQGNPKCLARDGGCGLSKRRWDITFNVE